MNDIKTVAAKAAGALQHMWERLSATQQVMLRGIGLASLVVLVCGAVGGWAPAGLEFPGSTQYNGTAKLGDHLRFREALREQSGELELARLRLARADAVLGYSSRYGVPADLAELIYDGAVQEGIDPELGFRLINVESEFKPTAASRAYAYGLTQLQVATARFYEPDVTMEMLFEPERNIRIGFRYLRDLLVTYGDINLALLAYNRGPSRIKDLMDAGHDPDNGYPGVLMEGYSGGF